MIEQIETNLNKVEILRSQVREFYYEACHNPCRLIRGRAGWELFKRNTAKAVFQRQIVELCDLTMSDKELYQLLKSENLQIQLK